MPSSSAASSGVPHLRQMTAPQSPQVSGSVTSAAHFAQYKGSGKDCCGIRSEIYHNPALHNCRTADENR